MDKMKKVENLKVSQPKRSLRLEKLPGISNKRKLNSDNRGSNFLKRKKSCNDKKYKDLLPSFKETPSDSSDEESGGVISNVKQKNPKNNFVREYKDFTENTIFVGNIPLNYDKKKLVKVFSHYGEIVCARIRCVPIANINMRKKVAAIKKEFNPHRNSLVAYIKFKSKESVESAIQDNGMILEGHHIRIDYAECSQEKDINKAIFVGGLPFSIEDDELWEFFEKCGKIKSVRIIRDSHTSMGKGIGYVNFDSTTAVELALQMDGQELKKRIINVKRCTVNRKKQKIKFGKSKSREVVDQLLSKKNKSKIKSDAKKTKTVERSSSGNFQGVLANVKQKKKKKLSKDALKKKRIMKILEKS